MTAANFIDADSSVFITSSHHMQSDLMGVVINTCKALPNVWQKLSEDQQQDFIDSIDKQIRDLVMSCVKTIAADDRPYVLAKVDQVVFKGGIEAKLKIERDINQDGAPSGAHDLADNTGRTVMIILPGVEEYEGSEGDKPTAQEDQPDLLDSASDDLYDDALDLVRETGRATISNIQSSLKIGYNRAARLIEIMEHAGVVSPPDSSGYRAILD